MRKIERTDIWQFLRFCIVGISNTAIDFAVLNLLLWLYPGTNSWETLGYNTVAVLSGATNSFLWNKYWTFRRRNPITPQEVYRFLVIACGTTLMSDVFLWLLSRAFPGMMQSGLPGVNTLKLGSVIATMLVSFFGMRLWVFYLKRSAGEDRSLADYETEKHPVLVILTPVLALPSTAPSSWIKEQPQIRNLRREKDTWVSVKNPVLADQVTLELPSLSSRPARLQPMRALHWAALALVITFSAFLNFFQLQQNGYGNLFYAAAVKSMLMNWHNFFYVSFDPSGFVTVDKPPLDLWLQTLSAKIFDFSGFSLLFPQALAGVITVALMFHLVRRSFGPAAGLISSITMATTPIAVAIGRNNNLDMMLDLVVVLAAWAVMVAAQKGQLRWLLLGAALLGIGFNVKMLEAYLVVPALALLYSLTSPRKWSIRLAHMGLALLVLLAVSFSWVLIVDLTPAADRPYVDSTATNSELDLAIGYNGIDRLIHISGGKKPNPEKHASPHPGKDTSLRLPLVLLSSTMAHLFSSPITETEPVTTSSAASEIGSAGPLRLLTLPLAGQIGWLMPLALLAMLALVWQRRWHWPPSLELQVLFFWGTWLLITLIFFSAAYFFHAYYTVTMAPAISALTGIGLVTLWRDYRFRPERDWRKWMLPVVIVLVVAFQVTVLEQYPGWSVWISPLLIALAVLNALALLLIPLFASVLCLPHNVFPAVLRVITLTGILTLLFAPLVWSSVSLTYPADGGSPLAGPRTMNIQEAWAELANSEQANPSGQYTIPRSEKKLLNYLLLHRGDTAFLLGTLTSSTAAPFILATGQSVMSLGGFGGNDPILTLAELQAYIVSGDIRFFLFPFIVKVKRTATSETEVFSTTGGQNSALVSWVAKHCRLVPVQDWENGRYVTVWKGRKKVEEFRPSGNSVQISNMVATNRLYDCVNIYV